MADTVNLKLNLGCGNNPRPGYVNVDRCGEPDVTHDLEIAPWPWENGSVDEVLLCHVLEHLGETVESYRRFWGELYRVCAPGAQVTVVCPHPRHDNFTDDPTHIRAVTPRQFELFDREFNRKCGANGWANSPLGEHWGIDFTIGTVEYVPSAMWLESRTGKHRTAAQLGRDAATQWGMIEEFKVVLTARKPHG